MNKDFLTMKTNVGQKIQDTSAAMATLIGTFLNKRYFQVLRAIAWKNIDYDYTFTTTGVLNYVLPDDFGKEISVTDEDNDLELKYIICEDTVMAQPTSSSALAITSTSSADTTQTILVRGISGGIETTETVTLTGTSAANTTNSYTRIKGISKSAVTTGKVTITSNSAAVTVAVLAPKVTESRYKLIKLEESPSPAISVAVPYITKPMPMTENNDYPVIDIADLLEIGAESDAWFYKRQGSKAVGKDTMFNIELQQYIFANEFETNKVIQFIPNTFNRDLLF
jgi:hypothetical protein